MCARRVPPNMTTIGSPRADTRALSDLSRGRVSQRDARSSIFFARPGPRFFSHEVFKQAGGGAVPLQLANLFRLIRLLTRESDKSGIIELRFSGNGGVRRVETSPLFELARVLVRLDHVASRIVKAAWGQDFRALAEDGFQWKARIEVLRSEPFAVIKCGLVFVP